MGYEVKMSRIYDALKSAQDFVAMNKACAPVASGATTIAPMHERRKQKRAAIRLPVRIRPADHKDGRFVEILGTENSSRTGLFCATASKHYHPGMWLQVTFPYHSAHDTLATSEDSGELLRVVPLANNRLGLAVLLRGPARPETLGSTRIHTPGRSLGERRLALRQPFTAAVTIISAHAQMRLRARTADLSANGCYVDTMNPYPQGTCLQLQLSREEKTFETTAEVRCSHPGMGMGLAFLGPPEQDSLLATWLSQEPAGYYSAS